MRTVTLSISDQDIKNIRSDIKKHFNKTLKNFHLNPNQYVKETAAERRSRFTGLAQDYAVFKQCERDGIVRIDKIEDQYFSFEDSIGDCYCPVTNSDISEKELKKQKALARSRFNRLGAFIMDLVIIDTCSLSEDVTNSICGFVGNDFYGSGYDSEFYSYAKEKVFTYEPNYIQAIEDAFYI